ncbi:MAG TPA: HEAT repeat domain-containing protein [Actinomycetales bacterium]|nr:HEAT repeat domain-containing protein [Actinomycetales bacterium]
MTGAGALATALVALAGLLLALALVTAAQRAHRQRGERLRALAAEPVRPTLIRLVAGEESDVPGAVEALAGLDSRTWAAVEPSLEGLLLKVKGDAHAAVVAVLEQRGSLARALARTRSRSAVARAHGAEVLGAAGRQAAVEDLLRLLADDDAEVRRVAARALGRIRSTAAAAPLLEAVSSRRPVPPRIIASAVMRIGVGAHPALVATLRDGDTLQRAIAAEIAGLAGATAAVEALMDALLHDPQVEVRVRSARALGRIGMPWATGHLIAATGSGQPLPLRIVASRALGDIGSSDAVPRLSELAADAHHRVASNAAASLLRCGAAGIEALEGVAAAPGGEHAREALAMARLRGIHSGTSAPALGGSR